MQINLFTDYYLIFEILEFQTIYLNNHVKVNHIPYFNSDNGKEFHMKARASSRDFIEFGDPISLRSCL